MVTEARSHHPSAQDMQEAIPDHSPRSQRKLRISSDNPIMQAYVDLADSLPPFSLDQELALGRRVQRGLATTKQYQAKDAESIPKEDQYIIAQGTEARNALVLHNLRYVLPLAVKIHKKTGASLEDLVQVGLEALIKATQSYNPDKGCHLSTYATQYALLYISNAANTDRDLVPLPDDAYRQLHKAQKAIIQKEADGTQLSPKEALTYAATIMNRPVDDVAAIFSWRNNPISSIDTPVAYSRGKEPVLLREILSSDEDTFQAAIDKMVQTQLAEGIRNGVRSLPQQLAEVVIKSHGLFDQQPQSLREIGSSLKPPVTYQTVSDRLKKCHAALKPVVAPYRES